MHSNQWEWRYIRKDCYCVATSLRENFFGSQVSCFGLDANAMRLPGFGAEIDQDLNSDGGYSYASGKTIERFSAVLDGFMFPGPSYGLRDGALLVVDHRDSRP